MKNKVAILLSRFPYPLDKGDKLRAYHQIKYLASCYEIHLFCVTSDKVTKAHEIELKKYCNTITLYKHTWFDKIIYSFWGIFKRYPFQIGLFYSKRIEDQFLYEISQLKPALIYAQLSRTAYYLREVKCPRIIDFQDAFSTNYKRISHHAKGLKKWFYQREGKLMKLFEKQMITWCQASTIISSFDKNEIGSEIDTMKVITNGVDTKFFETTNGLEKIYDLLFTGNLSYEPNQRAALFLIEHLMPALLKKYPSVTLYLAGAEPGILRKFASTNIIISGWLPDIREAYQSAKIFVAPLWTGAGLQNKLLEAMSMNLPCITTPIVNASLGANDNVELLVANHADEFISQIERLFSDELLRLTLATKGRTFVQNNYQWDTCNKKLKDLIDETIYEAK